MQINFDFLVSGCNTRCRHCYVAGGPGALMRTEDALVCLERLDELAGMLCGSVSLTLDHEPMNHPEIGRIVEAAARNVHIRNHHHGMTTGIALMRRADRDDVFRAYTGCGYDNFGITIHGAQAHHDEIVRRKGAYAMAVDAAEYFAAHGAQVEISLMVNRFFPQDLNSLSRLIDRVRPGYIGCVIPIYTPHRGMSAFEPYRASLQDIRALSGFLAHWGQDEAEYLARAEGLTIAAAAARLRQGPPLRSLFAVPQDELYLTLHQDCALYVGNSGAETRRLGNLRTLDLRQTADIVNALPGNRDYGAFYDTGALPATETLVRALESLPQDLVYGDFESAVYRGLDALNIPAVIMLT